MKKRCNTSFGRKKSGRFDQLFLIMRITTLLLLVGCMHLSAASWSQTINLRVNKTPIKEVFEAIKEQSGYLIVYNNRVVKTAQPVTISATNMPLEAFLNQLLKSQALTYKINERTIFIKSDHEKIINRDVLHDDDIHVEYDQVVQPREITGRVYDEKGSPMVGVTVLVKGGKAGTMTDADGRFNISVTPGNNILVFSYLGYNTLEQEVGEQGPVQITLQPSDDELNEIVIVGYGTQKKVNLTGAVSSVSGEDLGVRPVGQTSAALQGLAPGVTVTQRSGKPGGDAANIRIRGLGTIGNANPMVLIDGIEGSMNNIDPNLIESVSILKDAASASIYGSRAANGVILITTKRGNGDQLSVDYNNYVGWQNPTNMPKIVNGLDHMLLTNEAYVNTGRTPLYPETTIEGYRQANGVSSDAYPNTDWQKEVLTGNGMQQSHFLTINGGTQKVKMLTSFGYFDQKGIIENTGFKRYTIRNNVDVIFSDKLSGRIDMQYVNSITNAPATGVESIFQWANGLPANQPGINEDGSWGVGWNGSNPISAIHAGGQSVSKDPFGSINASLNYKPVEWLNAEVNYAPRYVTKVYKRYRMAIQSYLPDGTPSYKEPQLTSLTHENSQKLYNNMRATLTADKRLADHSFRWLVGASREDYSNEFINAFRDTYILPDYPVLDAGSAENQQAGGSADEWALQSFFSRLNYNFDEKYLLEVNARYDGSSRFAEGNRYGFFPSVSAGWRISEEEFMQPLKNIISEAKIRASWGRLGNQDIGDSYYPTVSALDMGSTTLGGQIINTVALNDLANKDISWETTEEKNIGIDVTLFKRLNVTADVYLRRTSDILLRLDIPLIIGLGRPFQNAGLVENKGWEVAVNYRSAPDNDLRYNLSFNISDVINRVLDMRGIDQTGLTVNREGYAINSIFGYQTAGLFQTSEEVAAHATQFGDVQPGDLRYIDQNNDGLINENDKVIIGSTVPRFTYALNAGMSYKGFDMSMLLQGVGEADGYLYGAGIMPFRVQGAIGGTIREENKDRWTPDNPNAKFPRLAFGASNNEQSSDFWLRNASYLRLKNIQIGYSLPKTIVNNIRLQGLRFFANGSNLLSFDNFWNGYDVEAPVGVGNFYPQVKVYTVGLEVTF